MAEHLMRKRLAEAGVKDVKVMSAGTAPTPWLGFPAEAQEALADYGVKNVAHKAQGVTRELVDWADKILCMEERHKESVLAQFPDAADKLESFTIRDPYLRPAAVYKSVLKEIADVIENLLKKI